MGGLLSEDHLVHIADAKLHGLRALCGLLMDRHSACRVGPFCGPFPNEPDEGFTQVIVHVESQVDVSTGEPLGVLYFCKAVLPEAKDGDEMIDLKSESGLEWVSRWQYADDVPNRKAVVQLLGDGTYLAEYGPIANPTKGDYSTGRLDRSAWRLAFLCDPKPAHTRWQYWPLEISDGQRVVPEFRCLLLRGEWWIFDIDRERRMIQQVAALSAADHPRHVCRPPWWE